MNNKRLLLSFVALLMLVLVLASCGTQGGADTSGNGDGTEASAPAELVLFENGTFNFKLIRAEHADDGIVSEFSSLRKRLEALSECEITMQDDYIANGSEHDTSAYEILFGYTNYNEGKKFFDGLNYGTYRIGVEGNKIILAFWDEVSAQRASEIFVKHVESLVADKRAVLKSDYFEEDIVHTLLSLVPHYSGGRFDTQYEGRYKDVGLLYKNTTADDFNKYVSDAVAGGCTLHASAQLGNNLSATLVNDKAVINAFFTASDKKTRLVIENIKNTSLATTEEENKYTKVCDSVLVQLGLEQPYDGGSVFTPAIANYNNGMGYIFRLHDGSFIIIDGGFNKNLGGDMLYNKLCELAPDKNNIVIAAWIMTHSHGDHMGTYRNFTERYAKKVKLERVIYNMGTDKEYASVNESTSNADKVQQYVSKYEGAVSAIARPGQIYHLRNAEIEVLHTIDLMRPATGLEGGNSICTATRITIEGQTYMFAGDSYPDMTASMVKNYGSYLKSDFVQVVHHGAKGASTEFYKAVDPIVVIWPLGTWDYYPWRRYETFNQYLFESATVKEIVLAGHTDRLFTLPYTYPAQKVLPPEIEVTWDYTEGKN